MRRRHAPRLSRPDHLLPRLPRHRRGPRARHEHLGSASVSLFMGIRHHANRGRSSGGSRGRRARVAGGSRAVVAGGDSDSGEHADLCTRDDAGGGARAVRDGVGVRHPGLCGRRRLVRCLRAALQQPQPHLHLFQLRLGIRLAPRRGAHLHPGLAVRLSGLWRRRCGVVCFRVRSVARSGEDKSSRKMGRRRGGRKGRGRQ
mmetsp:Transcript_2690/g.6429  ORF Transcript_2690/g.6429 Transcript_2690/m.6429 type:complete len:201 (+) Transcript_2690:430-1032(+)